jgi:hypothetical protein
VFAENVQDQDPLHVEPVCAERYGYELRHRPDQIVEAHVQDKQEPSVVVFFEILRTVAERMDSVRATIGSILVLVVVRVVLVEFAAARFR